MLVQRLRRRCAAALMTAAALSLVACGATPDVSASAPDTSVQGSELAASAVSFSGQTIDGGSFDSAKLAGEPAVLWFWAPWCTVCRAEAPDVARVADELAGEVRFVGIAGRGPVADMQTFVSDTGTDGFIHVADTDGSLWTQFGVLSQPSFVFVSADGSAERVSGGLDADQLRQSAESLITN